MAKKAEILTKFTEYFPMMAGAKLYTRRALLGPSATPTVGLQSKGTWVYVLGVDPLTEQIKPITDEVRQWSDVRAVMQRNNVFGCLFRSVIIERRMIDHHKQREYSDWFLRTL